MEKLHALARQMIDYERGSPDRIQHFLKVHAFARMIGTGEGIDARTLYILEAAALVHDIGIKPAIEKYGSSSGPLQEREGIAPAREMLTGLGFDSELVERVCTLVGRHHTYHGVDGPDCRILLEADFLVNLHENGSGTAEIQSALARIFRTKTGTDICRTMFGVIPARNQIIGALIGLVRASYSSPKSVNTDAVVIKALAFPSICPEYDETAVREMVEAIHKEKYTVSPGCAVCASPCGNISDYDMEQIYRAGYDICEIKLDILWELQRAASHIYRKRELDKLPPADIDLIHKALSYVSYDMERDVLLPLLRQARDMRRRLTSMEDERT